MLAPEARGVWTGCYRYGNAAGDGTRETGQQNQLQTQKLQFVTSPVLKQISSNLTMFGLLDGSTTV